MRMFWGGLLLLAACSGAGSETVVTDVTSDLAADRVLYATRFNTTVDGIRRAVQQSDSMYVYEDSTTAQLYGVRLMMYDTIGRRTADLRSRRGVYNQRTQKMVATGSVVLILADGRRLETEALNYDPESHRIWSDVPTRLTNPDGSVTNFKTFTSDDEFKNPQGTGVTGRIPGLRL